MSPKFSPEACALLREYLMYDLASGIFRWRKSPGGRARAGARAGCVYEKLPSRKRACGRVPQRYRRIRLFGVDYNEHQVAFLLMTGSVPHRIDHENCDGTDNNWSNLRSCSPQQNSTNRRLHSNSRSGHTGIRLWSDGRYRAEIKVGGRNIHLGLFASLADAKQARRQAEMHHFGKFARRVA